MFAVFAINLEKSVLVIFFITLFSRQSSFFIYKELFEKQTETFSQVIKPQY